MIFGHFLKQKKKKKKEKNQRKRKKHNEIIIKDRVIRNIRTLFEPKKRTYYKPKRVSSFLNNNYIEYESNGDKNRDLSLDEYLNNVKRYAASVELNYEEIKWNPERILNIEPFINKCNQEKINYPSKQVIEKRLRKIMQALNILYT